MSKFKNIALCLLIVWAVGASIALYIEYRKRQATVATIAKNATVVKQAATIVDAYVDKEKRNHVVIPSAENVLPANWYKNGTAISGGLIDTVASALNIARKQLIEVTQIATMAKAEKLRAERKIDSLQRVTYYYKDRYLQLAYRPAQPGDTTSKGEFDFKYNDSLNVVQYWKRKWLLGAKKSYIDIYSNDPRTTINGVKRLVVEQKSPAFGLRVQAVSNYNFSRRILNVGPGVQFDFKRLSLVGTYYYDFALNQWRPNVGLRYDIIRF